MGMELGLVGLGRMGMNMAARLGERSCRVVAYDVDPVKRHDVVAHGAKECASLTDLVAALTPSRAVWLMVPAGQPVDDLIAQLSPHLAPNDLLIDGGNSYYKDSVRRAATLKERGIQFLDVGTSGGVWGLKEGYCLMVGGEAAAYRRLEPVFAALAPVEGYAYVGPSGAGHYAKMIHNGIEYGLMEAYAEGFELLKRSEYGLDLPRLAGLWNHGSVIRSWLLELTEAALARDPDLSAIRGHVPDSGEGRWTLLDAIEKEVPTPALLLSLLVRFRSRQDDSFAAKLLAALRQQFGGHAVKDAR
jgi:6-phosphogluconate dehydrogenase